MEQEDNIDIEEIIARSLSGELREAEASLLKAWRNKSRQNEIHFQYLERMWRTKYQEPRYIHANSVKKHIMDEGFGQQNDFRHKKFRFNQLLRIAAVLLLCIGVGISIYYIQEGKYQDENVSEMILKDNPPGVKSMIMLSDGSVVWLNADSQLKYRKGFSAGQRFLELTGEAYFEVAKDANRPFIVKSGNVYTKALGTSFNIRSYREEPVIDVSLLTGKVSVTAKSENDEQTFFLNPDEQLKISRDLGDVSKTSLNNSEMAAWKDNVMIFKSAPFNHVIRTLERWYGIRIDTSEYSSRSWDYFGEFSNQSLEQVLTRIGYVQGFDFTINNDQVKIYEKGGNLMD